MQTTISPPYRLSTKIIVEVVLALSMGYFLMFSQFSLKWPPPVIFTSTTHQGKGVGWGAVVTCQHTPSDLKPGVKGQSGVQDWLMVVERVI